MKFYVPNEITAQIKDEDVDWLNPAEYSTTKNTLTLYQWSNGYIMEADEYFRSFFALSSGKVLPMVTEAEYTQFIIDKVTFLSKDRAKQFKSAWMGLR